MRLMIVLAVLALIPAINADPITYDFSVVVNDGPLSGVTANGSFTYDSSSILTSSTNFATGLLTSLTFEFDGIAYDQTTANTGYLAFDASGNLADALFGTNCSAGLCSPVGPHGWDLSFTPDPGFISTFNYTTPSGFGTSTGPITVTRATPEPSTILMFLPALVLVGALRRLAA